MQEFEMTHFTFKKTVKTNLNKKQKFLINLLLWCCGVTITVFALQKNDADIYKKKLNIKQN